MKKPARYIIYFLIGVAIYFIIDADDNPQVLDEFHSYAPGLILVVVVLLFIVKYVLEKKKKDKEE
ncbi:MAG: hypothetical protein RIC35_05375 [Marinoscillum sp.]